MKIHFDNLIYKSFNCQSVCYAQFFSHLLGFELIVVVWWGEGVLTYMKYFALNLILFNCIIFLGCPDPKGEEICHGSEHKDGVNETDLIPSAGTDQGPPETTGIIHYVQVVLQTLILGPTKKGGV